MTDEEFEHLLKEALINWVQEQDEPFEDDIEIEFSERHKRKMQKIFKMYRKYCRKQHLKEYRAKRKEIRQKIAERKRLKKLKFLCKKNEPISF